MTRNVPLRFYSIAAGLALSSFALIPPSARAQQQPLPPKTAAQQFKNLEVLKDIPADQLIPTMQFIAGSLGVDCDFCHVQHAMDKDDKKEKQTARKMIAMELAINKGHFDNEVEVTCYTCHRGSPHPVGTPVLNAAAMKNESHDHPVVTGSLPSPAEILDKYLSAVGGAESLLKIKTRIQKGTIDAGGEQYPIEFYSEGPEKRVSISHPSFGESTTGYNGQVGWLASPRGVHPMSLPEQQAARVDAQLYFPARLRDLYHDFQARPGEPIDGHATYLVSATAADLPPIRLYFDQQSGLLLRQIRFAQTPLGRNPTQIDYADYRDSNGVKIPFQWTLVRTNGVFTIRIASIQVNAPVDPAIFAAPAPSEAPHP